MISTLLIALREGLEAALIVGILAGALQGAGRSIRPVQVGVSVAIFSALLFGAVLFTTARELPSAAEEAFVGIASLLAVGLVTWMVFWMRSNARTLKSDLSHRLGLAISPFAVAAIAFFSVIREGIETSLFIFSTFKSIASTALPTIGLVLGFAIAITLGFAIYKQSYRVDIAKFFKWTSVALIVVASGVLSYGIAELEGAFGLTTPTAFDFSSVIAEQSVVGHLLAGLLSITPTMSIAALSVYVTYLVGALTLLLRRPTQKSATQSPTLTHV